MKHIIIWISLLSAFYLTHTVVKVNHYPLYKLCQPGQTIIFSDPNAHGIGLRCKNGNIFLEPYTLPAAEDGTFYSLNITLTIEQERFCTRIATDTWFARSPQDIILQSAYIESNNNIIVQTDKNLSISDTIFFTPITLFVSDRVTLARCILRNDAVIIQPNNPHSIFKCIEIIVDNPEMPACAQGSIDFTTDETGEDFLIVGAKEMRIHFNDHVFASSGRELESGYGTHMACLLTAVAHTEGPILEMGAGDYSTPLLHAVCSKTKRHILTTDTDRTWLSYFTDLENEWHRFTYVDVYEDDWELNPRPEKWDAIGEDTHWSVVFVDHRPAERRAVDIVRLRDRTDIFVVHDTDEPGYNYEPLLSSFKYRYVDTRYTTETTIVSDTIDVRTFFNT